MSLLIEIQKQDEKINELHKIIKQQAEQQEEAYEDKVIPTLCTLIGTDHESEWSILQPHIAYFESS